MPLIVRRCTQLVNHNNNFSARYRGRLETLGQDYLINIEDFIRNFILELVRTQAVTHLVQGSLLVIFHHYADNGENSSLADSNGRYLRAHV